MEQTLTNDAYVARPLNELSALSLGEMTPADLANVVRKGGTRLVSAELALREMTFRLIERERDAAREAEVGRLAIE